VPAGHGVQAEPVEKVPALQALHTVSFVAPITVDEVPGGHNKHDAEPVALANELAPHIVQLIEPLLQMNLEHKECMWNLKWQLRLLNRYPLDILDIK